MTSLVWQQGWGRDAREPPVLNERKRVPWADSDEGRWCSWAAEAAKPSNGYQDAEGNSSLTHSHLVG